MKMASQIQPIAIGLLALTFSLFASANESLPPILHGHSDSVVRNADHSVTFKSPKLLHGPSQIAFDNDQETQAGACRVFGFDSVMLDDTRSSVTEEDHLADLRRDGSFASFQASYAVTQLTCYHSRTLKSAKIARAVRRNPDGSYTFDQPRLLKGASRPAFDNDQETQAGACRVFGFDSVMLTETRSSDSEVDHLADLRRDGTFASYQASYKVKELTCYNSDRLASAGEAGNVIYVDGKAVQSDLDLIGKDGITLTPHE